MKRIIILYSSEKWIKMVIKGLLLIIITVLKVVNYVFF